MTTEKQSIAVSKSALLLFELLLHYLEVGRKDWVNKWTKEMLKLMDQFSKYTLENLHESVFQIRLIECLLTNGFRKAILYICFHIFIEY